MHTHDARELGFEMRNRTQIWIVGVEITEGPVQECKQLRFVMIAFSANLDQLDKVSSGLRAEIIFPDARERILDDNFSQRVQRRFAARHDRYFSFKKKIELAGERSLGPARTFRHGLDAA